MQKKKKKQLFSILYRATLTKFEPNWIFVRMACANVYIHGDLEGATLQHIAINHDVRKPLILQIVQTGIAASAASHHISKWQHLMRLFDLNISTCLIVSVIQTQFRWSSIMAHACAYLPPRTTCVSYTYYIQFLIRLPMLFCCFSFFFFFVFESYFRSHWILYGMG